MAENTSTSTVPPVHDLVDPVFFAAMVNRLAAQYLNFDTYVGNPDDYVDDDREFRAVLHDSAENDTTNYGRPASKSTVENLENVVMVEESMECPICMDFVEVGEVAKNLPCGHCYHGECLTTWLQLQNFCPVCRFELPTDDADYEKARKMRDLESSMRTALNLSNQ